MDAAHSQTTAAERAALSQHAAGRKRLAEIGVYEGLTTALLARAMAADGVLYAIDPFFVGRLGICWSKWIAEREVGKVRPARKIDFIEKLSFDAAPLVEAPLDFVFIDGDHSLGGIQRDWADWSVKIASGGVMALHDTRAPKHNPTIADLGSCRYFDEHIQHDARFTIVEQVDSLSVLRRKPETAHA
jgi:predicted O-methyltransferase YrrM